MHFIDIKFTDFLKLNLIEIATIAIKIFLDWSSVSNDPKTKKYKNKQCLRNWQLKQLKIFLIFITDKVITFHIWDTIGYFLYSTWMYLNFTSTSRLFYVKKISATQEIMVFTKTM